MDVIKVPVLPVGAFQGAGKVVWDYSSSRRADFYHNGLKDVEIDNLASPWFQDQSAKFVVGTLEKVVRAARRRTPVRLLVAVMLVMLAALVGWIFFLVAPHISTFAMQPKPFYLFTCVSMAGLFGATMQTLRSLRDGHALFPHVLVVDVGRGSPPV